MRRCRRVGFSAVGRSTRSRTCRARGGRPERACGYVQWRATNSRCHRSSVAGVTKKIGQRGRGSSRDSAASTTRSVGSSRDGVPTDEGPRPDGVAPAARHPWRPRRGQVGPTTAAPDAAAGGRPAARSCRHSDRAPNGPPRTKSHVSRMNPVLEPTGPGRPRKRPDMLIADKAYAHDPTVAGCAAAASLIPSRNGPTRSPAGPPRAATADDHWPSTSRSTGSETSWNAASKGSTMARLPPATPNEPRSTGHHCCSLQR